MIGRHQRNWSFEDRQANTVDEELNREMDEYLDLYAEEVEPVDGTKQLPQPKGRHMKPKEEAQR